VLLGSGSFWSLRGSASAGMGGIDLAARVRCISCDVQSRVERGKSYGVFGINKGRRLSCDRVSR